MSTQETYLVMRTILRGKYLRYSREIQGDLREEVLSVQDLAEGQHIDYEQCLFRWMNRPLDPRKEFPVRVLLLKKSNIESTLVFTFHHSAVDGLRALVFMRKVIENYNGVSNNSKTAEDIRLSRKADALLEFAQSQRPRVKKYYRKMIYAIFYRLVRDLLFPPARVFHDKKGKSREIFFCNATIDPAELKQIELRANSVGVELNDILLAACYRVVEKWNSRHGKPCKKVRVQAAVDISPKGFRQVLSNQMADISIPTQSQDRADPAKFLKKLRSDVIYAYANRTALCCIYWAYFLTRFPPVIYRQILRILIITGIYLDSIFFTNIGVVWPQVGSDEPAVTHIGDAKVVNLTGSAPVLSPWRLNFGTSIYNGTLNISLTYRPAMFSKEKIQAFLDLYVEEVKNYQVKSRPIDC